MIRLHFISRTFFVLCEVGIIFIWCHSTDIVAEHERTQQCVAGSCTANSNFDKSTDVEDDFLAPVVKIYSPLDGENVSGIVVITWEVLYFDVSEGYVEIELDGEIIETPLPLDPVSGNFLEPELVLDRSPSIFLS